VLSLNEHSKQFQVGLTAALLYLDHPANNFIPQLLTNFVEALVFTFQAFIYLLNAHQLSQKADEVGVVDGVSFAIEKLTYFRD